MKSEIDFENLLSKQLRNLAPVLSALLEDNKLYLTYVETADVLPEQQIFRNQTLIPTGELLLLQRKALLTDTRILLPFWYSMPIITAIIMFFRNLGKKKAKTQKRIQEKVLVETTSDDISAKKNRLKQSAEDFVTIHLPQGKNLDQFLIELQKKWNRLIHEDARNNLIEDLNTLIRDHVRRMLRIQKNTLLTDETILRMTKTIINETPALRQFEGDNLTMYIELYIAKLVMNAKM
jgi:hypothetical protein